VEADAEGLAVQELVRDRVKRRKGASRRPFRLSHRAAHMIF
jgi:hypothetical protein